MSEKFSIISAKKFLLEEIQEFKKPTVGKYENWYVWKLTLPNGKTKYTKTGQNESPVDRELRVTKALATGTSEPMNSEYKRDLSNFLEEYGKQKLLQLIDAEFIQKFDGSQEDLATELADKLTLEDPKAYPRGRKGGFGSGLPKTKSINNTKKIELKKSDTLLTKDGKVFINTLALQKDKELAETE